MTLSLWNLVVGSNTLHRRVFIGNFLSGASSQFWPTVDSQTLGLGCRQTQKSLKRRGGASGLRIWNDKLQLCVSGSSAGRCGCAESIKPNRSNGQFSANFSRYHGCCQSWGIGIEAKLHPRFAIRASSSGSLGKKSGSSKTKLQYVCENCGETFSQWWGACQNCKEMNTLKEFREPVLSAAGPRGGAAARAVERMALTNQREKEPVIGTENTSGKGAWLKNDSLRPQRLADVVKGYSKQHWRLALPGDTGSEVSRVLGGGIVPGSLILVGGDPGVGKSTLLLQIAGLLALGYNDDAAPVLYISGEESVEQISDRADRMQIGAHELFLFSATDLENTAVNNTSGITLERMFCNYSVALKPGLVGDVDIDVENQISHWKQILFSRSRDGFLVRRSPNCSTRLGEKLVLEAIQELKPRAVIVDSIQTVYLPEATGSAGSVIQVRECAAAMLRLAKQTSIPIFLVGHVTKTGDIAGPRVLEHIVDVVLYMEGERLQSHRLLRVVKNRYGSSDEVGVFEMVEGGLKAITNPSALFLSERAADSNFTSSSAVAVTMEGSRPILLEVQALCSLGSHQQGGRRTANGVDNQRLYLLLAVLMKQAGLKLQNQDVFINVVGGLQLREPASDVAVAIAICSSFLEKPVPRDMAFIGEIGLGGEIRSVGQLERRITEAAKLGFKSCVVPRSAKGVIKNITAIPCADLREVLERALGWPE